MPLSYLAWKLFLVVFIYQHMVDVENNTTIKMNLNNITKQMFVHNIQFVNNMLFKQFAYSVFRVL